MMSPYDDYDLKGPLFPIAYQEGIKGTRSGCVVTNLGKNVQITVENLLLC